MKLKRNSFFGHESSDWLWDVEMAESTDELEKPQKLKLKKCSKLPVYRYVNELGPSLKAQFNTPIELVLFSYLFRLFSFLSKWWWEHEEGIWGQSNKGESQELFPGESRFSFWCRPEWCRCLLSIIRPLAMPVIDVRESFVVISLDVEHRGVKSPTRSSLSLVLIHMEEASAHDEEAYDTLFWSKNCTIS